MMLLLTSVRELLLNVQCCNEFSTPQPWSTMCACLWDTPLMPPALPLFLSGFLLSYIKYEKILHTCKYFKFFSILLAFGDALIKLDVSLHKFFFFTFFIYQKKDLLSYSCTLVYHHRWALSPLSMMSVIGLSCCRTFLYRTKVLKICRLFQYRTEIFSDI
jgi:hypothetical protein